MKTQTQRGLQRVAGTTSCTLLSLKSAQTNMIRSPIMTFSILRAHSKNTWHSTHSCHVIGQGQHTQNNAHTNNKKSDKFSSTKHEWPPVFVVTKDGCKGFKIHGSQMHRASQDTVPEQQISSPPQYVQIHSFRISP